jgi:alpha-ketoglutarate-dependent taurine dioxygenase
MTPIIGAEIAGIDLSQPLSNRQQDEVHRALAENSVIFFRDQHITLDQHAAFGRLFGDLHVHPAAPHEPGRPELMIIHADKDSPRANGEGWHTDVSCDVEPPMGSILYIKKCPPKGGDTLFASMYAAYDALSDRMKTYLDGLTAIHDGESVYRGLYKNFGVSREGEVSARRASGGAHPSGHAQEGTLCESRLHPRPGRRAARRERRHPELPLPAHGEPAVPVPLPLAGELDRLLGQPLRPAPRDVGLLAAHAQRK